MPEERKKKGRTPEERSIDPAAQQMLIRADALGLETAFSRAEQMAPCPIGATGSCCKMCFMGPCRLVKDGQTGVCGATIETITARNFALDLSELYLAQFGQQTGEVVLTHRAPARRLAIWREQGLVPRGIDREIVDVLHRTHMGDDQDPEHLLHQALRASMGDGWGGSMIATDLSDILFGTPSPLVSQVTLGVLRDDEVNIVVHGHEPTLSEMILAATGDPELVSYAQTKAAKGITLAGLCSTR